MLDTRLPTPCSRDEAMQALEAVAAAGGPRSASESTR